MTAPSNANTSGLEVVAYLEVSKAGMGRRACLHQRKETPTMLRRWSSEPLVTAASAQAEREQYGRWLVAAANARDAAEARADRLAKALEPFARVARWARLCGMSDLEKATAKYAKRNLFWDQFSAADAALSGDTDHAG